jgi:hypothetical protein
LASFFDLEDKGKMDEADLNPNLVEFLGGNGGGVPSPICGDLDFPVPLTVLFIYFCRINRSIAESASSTSTGTGGLLCSGLYMLFDVTFPTFLMFCRFCKLSTTLGNDSRVILVAHIDLLVGPAVHTKRLDFGDMSA